MALSYASIRSAGRFIVTAEHIGFGCTGCVDFDDFWESRYRIKFRNGMEFSGPDKDKVIHDAKAYYEGVKNLTGEYP